MRMVLKLAAAVALALVVGVSSTLAARIEKTPVPRRLTGTAKHIIDLRDKDPKVRAEAAKELGCS